MNEKCFTITPRSFSRGILDEFVDITYILTLSTSTRKLRFDIVPTKKIYIVTNKSYQICPKQLPDLTPSHDLVDAYLTILSHARRENFNNILILEDDFIFAKSFVSPGVLRKVKRVIERHEKDETPFFFNLGPLPYLFYPDINELGIMRGLHIGCSQGIIYSKRFQEDVMRKEMWIRKQKSIKHWDTFIDDYPSYFYWRPLCYQLFPKTHNQTHWFKNSFILTLTQALNSFLCLEHKPEPGFTIIYIVLFLLNFIWWGFTCFFLLWVICIFLCFFWHTTMIGP